MSILTKKRSATQLFVLLSGALSALMCLVYALLTSPYGIFNTKVVICLVLAVILDVIICFVKTGYNGYLAIASVILTTAAAATFLYDCAGTIADYYFGVLIYGSGTPMSGIVTTTVLLTAAILSLIVGCFLIKDTPD